MAKTKAVPGITSRDSPAYWMKNIDASNKRRHAVNVQGARFARWHRGDMRDVVDPATILDTPLRWQSSLENMTNLATTASLADLLFRYPRLVIKSPYVPSFKPPVPGMPPTPQGIFTPELARCETAYMAHLLRRVKYLKKARRCLQDALIFDMGVLKVSADPDVVVDEESIATAQKQAFKDVQSFLAHGTKMKAQDDQLHSIHIQVWEQVLRQAEKGTPALPIPAKKYIKKHIAIHQSMKLSERPSETIRSNMIRVTRVNPMDYFYDPSVDDRDNASWRGHRYLMRWEDVIANNDFDPDARAQIQDSPDRWINRNFLPMVKSPGSFDLSERLVMIYELYDLVDQKVRKFADGGSVALCTEDRGDLRFLQPSGPFHELVFIEDTNEAQGIPVIAAFEAEQAAATHIASANVAAAIQSSPRTMYNSKDIDPSTAQTIWKSATGEFIPVAPAGDPKKPLEDCFAQVPAVEIPEQNLLLKADLIHGIERRSGLGAQKLGGGEMASTATGAALGADAATAISEDRGALIDEWQTGIACDFVRLTRALTPKSQIVEVCGDEAIEAWPDPQPGTIRSFSTIDACNDIAVSVVPGSSRRENTSVDQKQLLDLVTALAADPALQGPEAVKLRLSIYRAHADEGGVSGLDWGAVEQEVSMMGMLPPPGQEGEPEGDEGAEGAAPGGPGSPGGPPGGPGVLPGPGSRRGPPGASGGGSSSKKPPTSVNDIQQGVANVGGGRVGTGASVGDKIRAYRGQAVGHVVNKGG